MAKKWIKGNKGVNKQFKRETLLNYATGRWRLNQSTSVGKTSELIRSCAPSNHREWLKYYFDNATQKKRNGLKISTEVVKELGKRLFEKLSTVKEELNSITEEECIDYIENLVLNRTYEGYKTEIDAIYAILSKEIAQTIQPAPDEWDRTYSVDYFIEINGRFIGLQIKPISSGIPLNDYQWIEMHKSNHQKFEREFGGKVFFVYSENNKIQNKERLLSQINEEINRLQALK